MFEELITHILKAEGWDTYTNHPADRGGPTKWGITQKAWAEYRGRDVSIQEMQEITEQQARDFYEKLYIIAPRFNALPEKIIPLVVDSGVNSGVRTASKWVQRAVGAVQDGFIGPKTIEAVNSQNQITTFLRIVSYRTKLYGRLVSNDPKLKAAKEAGFRLQAENAAGWNNRIMSFVEGLADSLK